MQKPVPAEEKGKKGKKKKECRHTPSWKKKSMLISRGGGGGKTGFLKGGEESRSWGEGGTHCLDQKKEKKKEE